MSNKLPTIYLPLFDGRLDIDTDDMDGVETAMAFIDEKAALREMQGAKVVPYEPAVPRCRTCYHWKLCNDGGRDCCKRFGLRNMPIDGSGYCSEHVEARR